MSEIKLKITGGFKYQTKMPTYVGAQLLIWLAENYEPYLKDVKRGRPPKEAS